MQVFIPLDEEHPEAWPASARLVPYRPGLRLPGQLPAPVQECRGGFTPGEAPARPPAERPAPPLSRN